MNRYRAGGPSKASSTTLCQKCLKKGHFSYECTAAQQERPYAARPSRSQQLLNPKLAPKLSAVAPPADSIATAKSATDYSKRTDTDPRGRKRSIDVAPSTRPKRRRSFSSGSSDSVATISTNRSPSRSPPPRKNQSGDRVASSRRPDRRQSRSPSRSVSPDRNGGHSKSGMPPARPRSRSSSPDHRSSRHDRSQIRRSRSPRRDPIRQEAAGSANVKRERSLSPYSQRIALTKSIT